MIAIRDALALARAVLAEAGLPEPAREARALVAHLAGTGTAEVATACGAIARPALDAALQRRAAREPMAYIAATREFYGLAFAVSPATLIPRPCSETLVDAMLRLPPGPRVVLDLGTGTGCLLLALLHQRPDWRGIGIDRSPDAARLAQDNARALDLASRAAFVVGDWADAIAGNTRFGVILSNPPYIPSADIAGLMPEVARHEPPLALDGGPDGLSAYRALAPVIARHLAPDGLAAIEVGHDQAAKAARLFMRHGLHATVEPDLSAIPRVLLIKNPFGSTPADG